MRVHEPVIGRMAAMSISSTLIDGKRCWTPLRSSNGGYFENEGLQTALDLAEWLAAQSTPDRPVLPIIMQATGDGEADVTRSEVMTCDKTSDGAFIPDDKHSALQILAPLIGLYHVRGGHSAVLLRQAHCASYTTS